MVRRTRAPPFALRLLTSLTRSRRLGIAALAISTATATAVAQSAAPKQRELPRALDAPPQVLDRSTGLNRETIYATVRGPDGTLWIGTTRGPRRMIAGRFEPVPLPPDVRLPNTRTLHFDETGRLWAGTHSGVFHLDGDRWIPHGRAEGLATGRVWSIASWFDDRGQPAPVFSIEDTVYVRRQGRFVPLQYHPAEMSAAMLARTAADDGAPRLWIASLQQGVFIVSRDGRVQPAAIPPQLRSSTTEDVRPCPQLGPAAAIVATRGRVLTYDPVHGWRSVIAGQPFTRAVCARDATGRTEYWMGGSFGDVWRLTHRGVLQRAINPEVFGSEGLQGLSVVEDSSGASAIYVGRFSAWLVRHRAGPAISYRDRLGGTRPLTSVAVRRDGDQTTVVGIGPAGSQMVWPRTDALGPADPAPTTAIHAAPGGGFLGISSTGSLWRRDAGAWREITPPAPLDRYSMIAAWGNAATPTRVIVTAREYIYDFDGARWTRWPAALRHGVFKFATDSAAGVIWVASPVGLQAVRFRGDTLPTIVMEPSTRSVHENTSVTTIRRPDGRRLVALGTPTGLRLGVSAPTTRSLHVWPEDSLALPTGSEIRALTDVGDGSVLLGTSSGVVQLRVGDRPSDKPVTVAAFSVEDGLPSAMVGAIALDPSGDSAYVTTSAGLASIRLGMPRPPARSRITIRAFTEGDSARPVRDGARLPSRTRTLLIWLGAPSEHREAASTYRVELVRDGRANRGPWLSENSVRFQALQDGAYTLRVVARDWLGRETAPATLSFTILPPAWRSPWALMGYLFLVSSGVVSAVRVRRRRMRRRIAAERDEARRVSASERRFRQLFDRAADAQVITDGQRITAANAPAEALLSPGRPGMLAGMSASMILPDTVPPDLENQEWETEATDLEGRRIPVFVRRTRLAQDEGFALHYQIRDLRETRRLEAERATLEEQLLASQRLESLGTLAGGVAHDFNNLLTVIRTNTELARDALHDPSPEDATQALEAVQEAGDRARDIVRQILLFSRRGNTVSTAVNLATLVADAKTLLRATIPKSVQLLVELRQPDAWIMADRTQLQQMLLNLCSNAEHAMRAAGGGVLRVSVDTVKIPRPSPRHPGLRPGRFVRLEVADTGAGMPPEVRARIFEPFFTTKPVGEGTGLGLAVLHGIVTSHQGSVHVDSSPGKGTLFEVLLPEAPKPTVDVSTSVPTVITTLEPATHVARLDATPLVLLVDDEPAILRAAERGLRSDTLRVLTAINGVDALELVDAHPDLGLIITDHSMPGMTGCELARAVRERGRDLPIVLATGFVARIPESERRAAALTRVLEKPYTLDQLSTLVRALVAQSHDSGSMQPA